MSTKKSAVKKPESKPVPPEPEKQKPQEAKPPEQPPELQLKAPESSPAPQPEKPKLLTLAYLNQELQSLKQMVDEHANLMTQLQEILIRKRKPWHRMAKSR